MGYQVRRGAEGPAAPVMLQTYATSRIVALELGQHVGDVDRPAQMRLQLGLAQGLGCGEQSGLDQPLRVDAVHQRHRRPVGDLKLTPAARETLAIIAYRQPIMRADVEAIRGVQCGEVLSLLMDKQLVRIAGRDDSLGRPMLYGTTKRFLQWMGLKGLDELPRAAELRRPSGRPHRGGAEEEIQ